MQTGSEQLREQQRIMNAKKFYYGKLDGIWGPKTIAAKQKWEVSGQFSPGIPNNGFPLPDRGPFPKGVKRLQDGRLSCVELEQQDAKQQESKKNNNQQPQQAAKEATPPAAALTITPQTVPTVATLITAESTPANQPNSNQQNPNQQNPNQQNSNKK